MRCKQCGFEFENHVYLGKRCPNCGRRVSLWRVVRERFRDWNWFIATIVFILSVGLETSVSKFLGFEIEGPLNLFLLFYLPCATIALICAWWLRREDID